MSYWLDCQNQYVYWFVLGNITGRSLPPLVTSWDALLPNRTVRSASTDCLPPRRELALFISVSWSILVNLPAFVIFTSCGCSGFQRWRYVPDQKKRLLDKLPCVPSSKVKQMLTSESPLITFSPHWVECETSSVIVVFWQTFIALRRKTSAASRQVEETSLVAEIYRNYNPCMQRETDLHKKGESFSRTFLLATSLEYCSWGLSDQAWEN